MKMSTHIENQLSYAVLEQKPVRKAFHINDIISLYTGYLIAKEGAPALYRLVAFLMECESSAAAAAKYGAEAKQCLEEQLPFLKDVRLDGLYAIIRQKPDGNSPYLDVWRETQALRFGEEHYLVPQSKWRKQKNAHKL